MSQWHGLVQKLNKQKTRLVRVEDEHFFKAAMVGSIGEKVTPQGTRGWVLTGGNEQSTKVWGRGEQARWQSVGWPYSCCFSQHSYNWGEGPALAQGGLQNPQDLFQLCFSQSLKLLQGTEVQSNVHEWKVQLSKNDSVVPLSLDPHGHSTLVNLDRQVRNKCKEREMTGQGQDEDMGWFHDWLLQGT